MTKPWPEVDVARLRELWWDHTPGEVCLLFPKYSEKAIKVKAQRIKPDRSEITSARMAASKAAMLKHRNTQILGTARTYERAKEVALKYSNRTEFYRNDNSMYQYIRDHGLWDELCGHINIGNFNYSESFLAEVIRVVFEGSEVLRNSRKIIKPFELDVYLPMQRVAFEYDGSWWHSSDDAKQRDAMKNTLCCNHGICLYRIAEIRELRATPEYFIVKAVGAFGFDVSGVDIETCSARAFAAR